jgi:protein-S-isoprenylcysteine O-methyltransferase Ste14
MNGSCLCGDRAQPANRWFELKWLIGEVRKLANKTVLGFTQLIVALGTLLFGTAGTFDYWQAWVYMLVLPSVDHRFSWSVVPLPVVIAGDILAMLCFLVVLLVFRVNTFTAATIEVAPNQKVVSTGPYAIVRHPYVFGGAHVRLRGLVRS